MLPRIGPQSERHGEVVDTTRRERRELAQRLWAMLSIQGRSVREIGRCFGLGDNDVVELALMGETIQREHLIEVAYQRGRRHPLPPLMVVHQRRAA